MSSAITRVMALVTSSACLALPAGAAEPKNEAAAPSGVVATTRVDVVLVGRAGTDGALGERIESWFSPATTLSITKEQKLVTERVLGPLPTRRVVVWVTERTAREARIYFAVTADSQEATRYLVRDVPLDAGFDELGGERVAQVVHSSVTALIEGSVEVAERPEIERVLATPVEPAKPSLARARKPVYVSVPPARRKAEPSRPGHAFLPLAGAFYRGAYAGDDGFAHGPGVALGATFDFGEYGLGAVARGQYVVPRTEDFDGLDIELSGFAGRLGARGALFARPLVLDLELGGGFSWVRYDPLETASGPIPGPRDVDPRFFAFASLGPTHDFGPARLGARVELEIYPVRSVYKLETGEEIGAAARFQPGLVLEIVFD
jgi:hypothetical protein